MSKFEKEIKTRRRLTEDTKYSEPISPGSLPLAAARSCKKLTEPPNETKSQVLHKVFHPNKSLSKVPKLEDEWSLKDHPSWKIMFNILEPKVDGNRVSEQESREEKLENYIRLRQRVLKLEDDLFPQSPPKPETHCQCCNKNPANMDSTSKLWFLVGFRETCYFVNFWNYNVNVNLTQPDTLYHNFLFNLLMKKVPLLYLIFVFEWYQLLPVYSYLFLS